MSPEDHSCFVESVVEGRLQLIDSDVEVYCKGYFMLVVLKGVERLVGIISRYWRAYWLAGPQPRRISPVEFCWKKSEQ